MYKGTVVDPNTGESFRYHSKKKPGPQHKKALARLSKKKRLSSSKVCTVVFFHGKKGSGAPTAIQRCEGRSLKTQAKRRWSRIKGKKVCREKGGHLFRRCR